MRFSGLKIFREGLTGNKGWTKHWRDPEPKKEYDILIIGGGGHGLSTAYYLAKNHGLKNIAVLEKGYLGGGNVGRNTTIVRANYFLPGNSEFYSHSLKLWENLENDLNYNVMHSQRGLINLFHSDGQRDAFARRGNAMINQGDDARTPRSNGHRRCGRRFVRGRGCPGGAPPAPGWPQSPPLPVAPPFAPPRGRCVLAGRSGARAPAPPRSAGRSAPGCRQGR